MATLVFVANLVISYFKEKKGGNHPWDAWALEWSGRCMQKKRIPSDVAAYLAEHYTDEPLSVCVPFQAEIATAIRKIMRR